MAISSHYIIILIGIFAVALIAYLLKKIDFIGALIGMIIAYSMLYGMGQTPVFSLLLFFMFGSIASSWKRKLKINYGLEQDNSGKRSVSNVLANGGVAGILSILSFIPFTNSELFSFMTIASIATACSDTFSSEFGNVYGKNFFNIISRKHEKRGVDGAVSFEGLLFGLIGSTIIASSVILFQGNILLAFAIILCGFLGNVIDSILGEILQQKRLINNHQVNFLATSSGAILGMFCYLIIQG